MGGIFKLQYDLIRALQWIIRHLKTAEPKRLGPRSFAPPVIILTDGACEPDCTSVGGVMFDPEGDNMCFGAVVSKELLEVWKTKIMTSRPRE